VRAGAVVGDVVTIGPVTFDFEPEGEAAAPPR
jgi:hypothetical protein